MQNGDQNQMIFQMCENNKLSDLLFQNNYKMKDR